MERFDREASIELKPQTGNFFSRDVADTTYAGSLAATDVIWAMSQNVEPQKLSPEPSKAKRNFIRTASIFLYVARENPVGTIQTLAKYASEKMQQIRDDIPVHALNGYFSTSYQAPIFPSSIVRQVHIIKTSTPNTLPPQS